MSLLGHMSSIVPGWFAVDPGLDADRHGDPPPRPAVTHLLIHNDPDNPCRGYGPGWTLLAQEGTEQQWTVALAGHGAGALAETRVAKAVAVRVLGDRGIRVASWSDGSVSTLPAHRAVPDTRPDPPASVPDVRWTPPPAGWRRGRSPGH